jgi:hypothetical protein
MHLFLISAHALAARQLRKAGRTDNRGDIGAELISTIKMLLKRIIVRPNKRRQRTSIAKNKKINRIARRRPQQNRGIIFYYKSAAEELSRQIHRTYIVVLKMKNWECLSLLCAT